MPALTLGAEAGGASPGRPVSFPLPALGSLAAEKATPSWTGSMRLAPPAPPLATPAPPRGENTAKLGIDCERKLGGGIAADPKLEVGTLARGGGLRRTDACGRRSLGKRRYRERRRCAICGGRPC